jgi:hypothetical protein
MEKELLSTLLKIVNEDGTSIDDYPKNPLMEKWKKLYPPIRYGEACSQILGTYEDGRPIMNYSCVLCCEEKCIYSDNWKVPEEDLEIYNEYLKELDSYNEIHNPTLCKTKIKNR